MILNNRSVHHQPYTFSSAVRHFIASIQPLSGPKSDLFDSVIYPFCTLGAGGRTRKREAPVSWRLLEEQSSETPDAVKGWRPIMTSFFNTALCALRGTTSKRGGETASQSERSCFDMNKVVVRVEGI